MQPSLVALSSYGIRGENYYFTRRDRYQISLEELGEIGITDAEAYVDEGIIPALQQADAALRKHGYTLIIKDAFRSPELYSLIHHKRLAQFGEEHTNRLINMDAMPHSSGRAVDIGLIDLGTETEVHFRNNADDPDAYFINFYANRTDDIGKGYHRLQTLLIETMQSAGFVLGSKGEYWHFELPSAQ